MYWHFRTLWPIFAPRYAFYRKEVISIDALRLVCILLTYPEDFSGIDGFIQDTVNDLKQFFPIELNMFLHKKTELNELYPEALERIQKYL